MQRIRSIVVGLVCAVVALTAMPSRAQAELVWSVGCVQWSAANGCEVTQICAVDTDYGDWACCTYPDGACTSGSIYPPLIASLDRRKEHIPIAPRDGRDRIRLRDNVPAADRAVAKSAWRDDRTSVT